ncbi:hypothetical protein CHUAL_009194 [Chamberlinius hualienensis]
MMPLAPTPIMPIVTKPKIGFSIESLVGQTTRNRSPSPANLLSPTNSSRPSSSSNASIDHHRPASRSPSPSGSQPSPQEGRSESDDVRPRSFSPSNFIRSHHLARPLPQHHNAQQSIAAAHLSSSTATLRQNVRCESPSSPIPHSSVRQSGGGGGMATSSSAHGPSINLSGPFFDSVNSMKGIYAPEPTYTNGLLPGLAGHQPIPCAPIAHLPHHPACYMYANTSEDVTDHGHLDSFHQARLWPL